MCSSQSRPDREIVKDLHRLQPTDALRGAWCDNSMARSATLEALSFVTPALEQFFVRAVRDTICAMPASDLRVRAQEFVREESLHSAAHRRLNRALSEHLGCAPPSLFPIESLLRTATRMLSLDHRLLLVEVMEHASAIASGAYLRWAVGRRFDCAFASRLFAQHAREEIGHVSIIRDLRMQRCADILRKGLAWALMTAVGAAYLGFAIPWVIVRKTRRRPLTENLLP